MPVTRPVVRGCICCPAYKRTQPYITYLLASLSASQHQQQGSDFKLSLWVAPALHVPAGRPLLMTFIDCGCMLMDS